MVLCVLATDEEDEDDIALQIHFTLIQAFCCDNDINILRVSGLRRLAQVLCEPSTADNNGNEPKDLHCILVTVSSSSLLFPVITQPYSWHSDVHCYPATDDLCVFVHLSFAEPSVPAFQVPSSTRGGELL